MFLDCLLVLILEQADGGALFRTDEHTVALLEMLARSLIRIALLTRSAFELVSFEGIQREPVYRHRRNKPLLAVWTVEVLLLPAGDALGTVRLVAVDLRALQRVLHDVEADQTFEKVIETVNTVFNRDCDWSTFIIDRLHLFHRSGYLFLYHLEAFCSIILRIMLRLLTTQEKQRLERLEKVLKQEERHPFSPQETWLTGDYRKKILNHPYPDYTCTNSVNGYFGKQLYSMKQLPKVRPLSTFGVKKAAELNVSCQDIIKEGWKLLTWQKQIGSLFPAIRKAAYFPYLQTY